MKKTLILLTLSALLLTSCGFEPVMTDELLSDFVLEHATPAHTFSPDTPPPREPFAFTEELNSRAACVIAVGGADCGTIVFAFNEDERLLPASTLKMMTFLVALELLESCGIDTDTRGLIEVPPLIWLEFDTDDPNTVGGSMSGIVEGQTTLTYRDLFHALMLRSGNEAANIIAHNLGGQGGDGISVFVGIMNTRAKELGLYNTFITNAHGLNEVGNRSTARDLAVIAWYGYRNFPIFREISGTFEYVMPANRRYVDGYRIRNTNSLIRNSLDEEGNQTNQYFREFAQGGKTGSLNNVWTYDRDSGDWLHSPGVANLVSFGQVDSGGQTYIVVTLEAPWRRRVDGFASTHFALLDHIALYERLFDVG
jgi:D-alanyl-D-alanine carboxypeptidase